jgi:hypothetical protein
LPAIGLVAVLVNGILDKLRAMLDEHEADDWMYEPSPLR